MHLSLRTKSFAIGLTLFALFGGFLVAHKPGRAEAHPLGNFTINRYSRIELAASGVHVRYVIDMAEIPTYQERAAIDQNGDGELDESEQSTYIQKKARDLEKNLELEIDGSRVALQPASSVLTFLPGQGGLDTQRMVLDYTAVMPDGSSSARQLTFHDRNHRERIGWREIVVRPLEGVRLESADVPQTEMSNELLSYRAASISNPPDVTSVSFEFSADEGGRHTNANVPPAMASKPALATRGNPDSTLARYAELISKKRLSAGVIVLALLAAIGFGALHAMSPGHGKTVVGAYLVGSRGTWRHALLLALVVTATHTSSVYALGFVTLYLSAFIVPEDLYPWLSIASGGLVLAMGLTLLVSRLRTSRLLDDARIWLSRSFSRIASPQLAFEHANAALALDAHQDGSSSRVDDARLRGSDVEAAHMHRHGFGRPHSHGPIDQAGRTLTWRGLIGLGVFGGLLPCPSAIVVMLSAIALHRVAFGLLLIVAFSFGLAIVLTSIGLLLLHAAEVSRRLPFASVIGSRLNRSSFGAFIIRALPATSAAAVVLAGVILTARGLAQQGLL